VLSPSAYVIYIKAKKGAVANQSGVICYPSKSKAKKGIVLAFEEGCHRYFFSCHVTHLSSESVVSYCLLRERQPLWSAGVLLKRV